MENKNKNAGLGLVTPLMGLEDNFFGGAADDVLTGTSSDDFMSGGNGNDRLNGMKGNDFLSGNNGDDLLIGWSGDDNLDGGNGNDELVGGTGNDFINGGNGHDVLHGDEGKDVMDGGAGNDILKGGSGDDLLTGGSGNDDLNGGKGDDIVDGGAGDDILLGWSGDDQLLGGSGNDQLIGGTGDDILNGGSGNDVLHGDGGNDQLYGGRGNDVLKGGSGDDILHGGRGNDDLNGGRGNDIVSGGRGADIVWGWSGDDVLSGDGGKDQLMGGTGNDRLDGGAGNDELYGDEGADIVRGGKGQDLIKGGSGNDILMGEEGRDNLNGGQGDDRVSGGAGNDIVWGWSGNDILAGGSGNDVLNGGTGDDIFLSFSDGGEPVPAQDATGLVNEDELTSQANDVFIGEGGTDSFHFALNIDAKDEIIARHTDAVTGRINWQGVAGENDNVHDHWVDSIGHDEIRGFSQADGDKIIIEGHTVKVDIELIDEDGDGRHEYSLLTLTSDQGGNGGAHDQDALGTIKVYGNAVLAEDVTVDNMVFYGEDSFEGRDVVFGDDGNDSLQAGSGEQLLYGYQGDDILYALGDGGEPVPAQDASGQVGSNAGVASRDTLIGGSGADTFFFVPLLNAKDEILAQHRNADGSIDWQGVAGENGNVHDHWVEGVGEDVVFDFSAADGDKIVLEGHTVDYTITYVDSTDDNDDVADYSVLTLTSNQGGNGGAHDGDSLGTIIVYGDLVTEDDITVNSTVFHGVDVLDDWAV